MTDSEHIAITPNQDKGFFSSTVSFWGPVVVAINSLASLALVSKIQNPDTVTEICAAVVIITPLLFVFSADFKRFFPKLGKI